MRKTMVDNFTYFVGTGNDYISAIVCKTMSSDAKKGYCTRYFIKKKKYPTNSIEIEIWVESTSCNNGTYETVNLQRLTNATVDNFCFDDYFEKIKAIYNSLQNGDLGVVTLCQEIIDACCHLCKSEEYISTNLEVL